MDIVVPVNGPNVNAQHIITQAIFGKSQGFRGLPAIAHVVNDNAMGLTVEWVSAWRPNAQELELLNNGAAIYLHLRGDFSGPIPQLLTVGEPAEVLENVDMPILPGL